MSKTINKETFLPIYDLTKFTMLDFPDKTACVVWIAGCNFRCPYCHNPDIVKAGNGKLTKESILDFLKTRTGLLDGVAFSGGEPTLYEGLLPFIKEVRDMGFAIKLDTNGSRPDRVRKILDQGLVEYIAMDYKAPANRAQELSGVSLHDKFEETLDMLCAQDKVPFELRTTVHTDLLKEEDILAIIEDLKTRGYKGTYYIQNYMDTETLLPLDEQKRILDMGDLPEDLDFEIAFRNFE